MHIPWTPRTVLRNPEPEVRKNTICERTLDILQPVIFAALRPFPEARQALCLALL
jgi:hypothetical protein